MGESVNSALSGLLIKMDKTDQNSKKPFSVPTQVRSRVCGPGSSVGIATDYGLDGPGSNSGGNEIFRPSRPNLGPTQPPVKWVLVLSRW